MNRRQRDFHENELVYCLSILLTQLAYLLIFFCPSLPAFLIPLVVFDVLSTNLKCLSTGIVVQCTFMSDEWIWYLHMTLITKKAKYGYIKQFWNFRARQHLNSLSLGQMFATSWFCSITLIRIWFGSKLQ